MIIAVAIVCLFSGAAFGYFIADKASQHAIYAARAKGLQMVRVLQHVPYTMQACDPNIFGPPEEGVDATALAPAAAADPFGFDAAQGPASTEEVPW